MTAHHSNETITQTLGGLGVTATVLDGPSLTAALTNAVDPYTPPPAGPRATPVAGPTVRNSTVRSTP